MEECELLVIGGGPAGYVAALRAAQLGTPAVLVEQDRLGGTCLNWGCIPTKAYLKNVEIIEAIKMASSRGIILDNESFRIDFPAMMKTKDAVVEKLCGGVRGLLQSHGVKIIQGRAVLREDLSVVIDGNSPLKSSKIILAGGSQAAKVPIPGIETKRILTSKDLLLKKTLPKSLTVIGGGVIGMEMALILHAFGVKVTIVEMERCLLPFMDSSLSQFMEQILRSKGVEIHTGNRVEYMDEKPNALSLHLSSGVTLESELALLAVGRVPDLSVLGSSGIATDKGRVCVNEYLETSVPGIYAAGDITGHKMLAHAAFKMGEIAAKNALGARKTLNLRYVPTVVYSIPEIASLGLSEKQASLRTEVSTGYFPLSANGKALASGESEGFVKVVASKSYGEVLGVHIVAPGASEIINEAASLMAMEVTSHEIADIIHAHPTVGEAFMEAAADSLGRSLHASPKENGQ